MSYRVRRSYHVKFYVRFDGTDCTSLVRQSVQSSVEASTNIFFAITLCPMRRLEIAENGSDEIGSFGTAKIL